MPENITFILLIFVLLGLVLTSVLGIGKDTMKIVKLPKSIPKVTNKPKGGKVSIGEAHMTSCFENIFKKPFHKTRPHWLVNPNTGSRLELDCYNGEMKLAGEYNGRQHYEYTSHFHRSLKDFEKQKERDRIKESLCVVNGVKLITVPYTVKHTEMQKFIYDEYIRREV